MFSLKLALKIRYGSKHPKDKCYVFNLKLAIKMSATVGNTLRMNAMCSVQNKQ